VARALGNEAPFATKLAANPDIYGKVIVTTFGGDRHEIGPAGTVDLVVTFRNLPRRCASPLRDEAPEIGFLDHPFVVFVSAFYSVLRLVVDRWEQPQNLVRSRRCIDV
jgi:hypothetical protein